MPRPKKYPDYDPEKIMNELLEAVTSLYLAGRSTSQISNELDMDWQKTRKLLCTASYRGMITYDSAIARMVIRFYKRNKTVEEISSLTELSRSSILSYFPYTKVTYRQSEVSANAARLRLFRERKQAVEELKENPDRLWDVITLFQGYPFKTVSRLDFKYTIIDDAIDIDEMPIQRSTVESEYRKALEGDTELLDYSYLHPIFVRLGVKI